MAWTLCSKDDVVNIHPTTRAELKDEWSDMVEALIKQHLGQPYLGSTQVITDEYHDGDGTYLLEVMKRPIVSVQNLYINDVLITPSDYVVFEDYIQLKSGVFPRSVLNVRVSYTSGITEISDVIRLTAASMVVAILNYRRSWGSDSSLKWGEPDEELGKRSPNYNVGLTSHLTTIMKRMLRRPNVRVR